jgi:hypothetical protein
LLGCQVMHNTLQSLLHCPAMVLQNTSKLLVAFQLPRHCSFPASICCYATQCTIYTDCIPVSSFLELAVLLVFAEGQLLNCCFCCCWS